MGRGVIPIPGEGKAEVDAEGSKDIVRGKSGVPGVSAALMISPLCPVLPTPVYLYPCSLTTLLSLQWSPCGRYLELLSLV